MAKPPHKLLHRPPLSIVSRLSKALTRRAKNIQTALQALQVVSILVGGIYFLFQYNANITMEQKKASLKYAEKFFDRSLAGSPLDLDRPFQSATLKPDLDNALGASLKSGNICLMQTFYRENFLASYFKTDGDRQKFYSQLSDTIRATESVAICVNSKTCDLDTACNFFFDDALAMLNDHCIEMDRYKLQFGTSPTRETEKFLRACSDSPSFSRKVDALSYCEIIREEAAHRRRPMPRTERERLEAAYEDCPFTAAPTR